MRPLIKNSPEWLVRPHEERAKRKSLEEELVAGSVRRRQMQYYPHLWGQRENALVPLGYDCYR